MNCLNYIIYKTNKQNKANKLNEYLLISPALPESPPGKITFIPKDS